MGAHMTDVGYATNDARWSRPCSLMGCASPSTKHHHHFWRGHLDTSPCHCARGGEPGSAGPKVGA